jgi:exonuclease III
MRIASINLQNGLKTADKRARLERWLDAWTPDLLLAQEPCARGTTPPTAVGEYQILGGNGHVAAYMRNAGVLPSVEQVDERVQLVRIGSTAICNAYFPYEPKAARTKLFGLLNRELAARRTPDVLVFGDFNMAPRPEDGRYGDDEAKDWTGVAERAAMRELLEERGLVDVFAERAPPVEPYTFERLNRGKMTRFRCDFVLVSARISTPTTTPLYVAHDTRRGSGRFTDHSGIVIDAPLDEHPGQGASSMGASLSAPASYGHVWRRRAALEVIDDARTLASRVDDLAREPVLGLDVETEIYTANPRLCLVQIATASSVVLIDALRIEDLRPLKRLLEDSKITKVIHHAAAERTALGRLGFTIINVYDTEKASRRLRGGRAGHTLAEVCERELGVGVDKTEQRSNWATRPLTAKQMDYAAIDAEVLVALHAEFEKREPTDRQPLLFML